MYTCSLLETENADASLSAECPITSFVENSATAGAWFANKTVVQNPLNEIERLYNFFYF